MKTLFCIFYTFITLACIAENPIVINLNEKHQTMHSFGASDCWRTQFIGKNWPLEKREAMADYLFSTKFDQTGNPKGIGLSLWRFNIGSGSHEAGEHSGVSYEWRRTECFLDSAGNWDWNKQAGQRWFLEAARKRGVPYSLGFSISAPTFMSKNGMARASDNTQYANLKSDKYDDYANFMAEVSKKLGFDYLSPINEPQWNWTSSKQEGMQATNQECSRLIHILDSILLEKQVKTKIVFGEAGDIRYLYQSQPKGEERDNQIQELFDPKGKNTIAGLSTLAPVVTGHSYWSTWPLDKLVLFRKRLNDKIRATLPGSVYWQTEYCPMEKNEDNPDGGGRRDLGMKTALYIARVIHSDLTIANAASWQYWTAFSEWDYKDGLIYIDDGDMITGARSTKDPMVESCKTDGVFRTSKLMWMLGNYSLFIRPGMVRVSVSITGSQELQSLTSLMVSAYLDPLSRKLVLVFINYSAENKPVTLSFKDKENKKYNHFRQYITSESNNLSFKGVVGSQFFIPALSVVTLSSVKSNK